MAQQPKDTSHTESKTDSKTDSKADSDYYILDVQVHQAKDLKDADTGFIDKSDAYCVCTVDGMSYQTKTLGNNLNPVWNERCSFFHRTLPTEIRFELWDSDESLKDEGLGKVVFPLKGFFDPNHAGFDGWLDITTKGKLNVCIRGTHMKPQAMKEELNNLQLNNHKLKKELDEMREQRDKGTQQIVALTATVSKAEKQNTEWQEKTSNLEKQNSELKEKITLLEKQNRELFERYKNLEGLNAELGHQERVKLETLTNKLAEKETIIAKLEFELMQQRSQDEKSMKEKDELTSQLNQHRRDIQMLEASVGEKTVAIAQLQTDFQRQQSRTEELLAENEMLKQKLQESMEKLAESTAMISSMQEENIKVNRTAQDLINRLETLQTEGGRSQEIIAALNSDLASIQKELSTSRITNGDLKTQSEKLVEELMLLKKESEEIVKMTALREQMYRNEIEEQTRRCEELVRQVETMQAANNSYNNNNTNSNNNNAEIAALQERLQTLTAANERLTSEKKQNETEINALRQEVQRRMHSTQTTTMPLQHRSNNRLAALGSIAVASTAVFVLLWRMKRGATIEAGAVLK